jgi:hypothetical protein
MHDVAVVAVEQARCLDLFRRPHDHPPIAHAQNGPRDGRAPNRIAIAQQHGVVLAQLRRVLTAEDVLPLAALRLARRTLHLQPDNRLSGSGALLGRLPP